MADYKTIQGVATAYPDLAPWCSRCGCEFGWHDGFHWVEPQKFKPLNDTQPPYPDAAGFYVALCDACCADQLPPAPVEQYKVASCSYCRVDVELDVCKWITEDAYNLSDNSGTPSCDATGYWLAVCPSCFQANIDHFIQQDD